MEIFCAKCGASLEVNNSFAGQPVECPNCYRVTPVPIEYKEPRSRTRQIENQPAGKDHMGLAITSLILGIFSLAAWFLPICGIPISVVGLILGTVGKDSSQSGMAKAGVIMSVIGLVLGIINSATGAYLGATGQLFN